VCKQRKAQANSINLCIRLNSWRTTTVYMYVL